jgi:hypothetical protein
VVRFLQAQRLSQNKIHRRIPKMLTEKQKSKTMAVSLENVCHYQDEGESFVESIVTQE